MPSSAAWSPEAGWWALGGLAVGLLVGLVLSRWLGTRWYRYEDELDLPERSLTWLVPATAVVGAAQLATFRGWPAMVVGTVLVSSWTLLVLTAIDADVHRLPDFITLPAYPGLLVLLTGCSLAVGDWGALTRAVLTGLAIWGFFRLLAALPLGKDPLGMGDVKLSGTLGMLTGWFSIMTALTAVYAAVLLGGLWGVALLVTRRATLKTRFAYGPFLALGTILALLLV